MSRPRNPYPVPRCHKGRAVIDVYDGTGKRRTVTLGEWGSDEANRELARIIAERSVAAIPAPTATAAPGSGVTVNLVLLAHLKYATQHYRRPDGTQTSEVREFAAVSKAVRLLYGHTPANEFGPLALKSVRQAMIAAGWCRSLINRRVERIKRVFKWAASEELIPVAVYDALRTVPGLRRGRTEARESKPVLPVEPATVETTLPFLNRHVRAMVELQRLTGMRPGEVCAMRLADLDRSGPVWFYRPSQHKTQHHGRSRTVMIGPKGQKVLLGFLAGGLVEPDAPLFSPRRAREERFAAMREKRRSKVPPSQLDRRKVKPKLLPALQYMPGAYAHAIRKASRKAKAEPWHPNQLRHTYASEIRREHGLEAAQVLLGHSRADVTQVYAERNEALAIGIAAKIG